MDAAGFQARTGVSRETLRRYETWRRLLEERNAVMNLVGRSTLPDFWFRHALDSWQVATHAPDARRWLDLGAGAGFPGFAIAFSLMERGVEGEVTLVESIQKKADFLTEVAEATGAPVRVLPVRAESLDPHTRYDVVTARALTSLTKLLAYAKPFVDNGAICLFPKGQRYREELTEARKSWTFDHEVIPSVTSPDAAILRIEDVSRV
ncbi:16S rRNA (guanine(527)-N(7))-methyltransferase RsmG [Marinicauda algicola]|uniref:Ribosomal RNA small subunit methyltransferase G n=2 Tax=Marinicauda algicola TaxID=2029849 RepID=A0A4S2H127_9PROT|nr:16S rRNA (guanine(527)-N(7))-methyltransferase RsmG [Marinicauda algicola]TGY89008.1 16S rRNA (guanine(527)-N(7))-methyltransferase RsmG [Marinicauda algicola]